MKFEITFKSPMASAQLDELNSEQQEFAENFIEYAEYITIEFDPEADTAVAKLRPYRY